MNIVSFSKKGRKKTNQDSVFSAEVRGVSFLAIADGMGGKFGGEVASATVVQAIGDAFNADPTITIQVLFDIAHKKLESVSNDNVSLAEMGTTLTVCIIENHRVRVGHVGDTRVYHLRNSGIVSRTKDQTELQHLLDEGVISKRKAKSYKRKNILLSVLTPTKDYELYTNEFEVLKGDRLLLCTDGFYSLVSKAEIRDSSLQQGSLDLLLEQLLKTVESKEIHDDYSALLYEH